MTTRRATLDELGIQYNCDKSSRGRVRGATSRGHDFLRKYEFFLARYRERPGIRVTELGVGPEWNLGASAYLWRAYFEGPQFHLRMVDINPKATQLSDEGIEVVIGDLGREDFVAALAASPSDLIIDDASHLWGHQICALKGLFPSLRPGGIYIVEDIHTSFGPNRERFRNGATWDAHTWLVALTTYVAGRGRQHPLEDLVDPPERAALRRLASEIESITFIAGSCIICKCGFFA